MRARMAVLIALAVVFAPGAYGRQPHGLTPLDLTSVFTRVLLPTFEYASRQDDDSVDSVTPPRSASFLFLRGHDVPPALRWLATAALLLCVLIVDRPSITISLRPRPGGPRSPPTFS